jgi:hypothetical protein
MNYLLYNGYYVPATNQIGFIEGNLDEIAQALVRRSPDDVVEKLQGSLDIGLKKFFLVQGHYYQTLLTETKSKWVALFSEHGDVGTKTIGTAKYTQRKYIKLLFVIICCIISVFALIIIFHVWSDIMGTRAMEESLITRNLVYQLLEPFENFNSKFDVYQRECASKQWKVFLKSTENYYLTETKFDIYVKDMNNGCSMFYFSQKDKSRLNKTFIVFASNKDSFFSMVTYYPQKQYILFICSSNTREIRIHPDKRFIIRKKIHSHISDNKRTNEKIDLKNLYEKNSIFATINNRYEIRYIK